MPDQQSVEGKSHHYSTALVTIDDVSLIPTEGTFNVPRMSPTVELFRQLLGGGTFHSDMTGSSSQQGKVKQRSRVSHFVETHSVSGLLAFVSCPTSRFQDVLGARAGRQFATVNTSNWDVSRMSSVLGGIVNVFLEHCGELEGGLQSILPKIIHATATLVHRVQQNFDVVCASPMAAARRGGA